MYWDVGRLLERSDILRKNFPHYAVLQVNIQLLIEVFDGVAKISRTKGAVISNTKCVP